MIVTSDNQSFETLAEAQAHELQLFIEKNLSKERVDPEQVAGFVVDRFEAISDILKQKPKKAGRAKRKAKTVETVPGPGLPESGLPAAKTKRTRAAKPSRSDPTDDDPPRVHAGPVNS